MRKFASFLKGHNFIKAVLMCVIAIGCFYVSFAYAQDSQTLGSVASHIQGSFKNLAKLITGGAFLGGLGFAVGSILKFKAHKDNPTQIPIGTPIALLLVATALMFLPAVFKMAGQTVFSEATPEAGISGTASL